MVALYIMFFLLFCGMAVSSFEYAQKFQFGDARFVANASGIFFIFAAGIMGIFIFKEIFL